MTSAAVLAQEAPSAQQEGARVPLTGEVRALVVFVRFADDGRTGDGCAEGGPMWPAHADRPVFAAGLLSPTPGGIAPDSSLTALFRHASSGRFELYGSAFGHVTRHPESHYFPFDAINLDRRALTLEILAALRDDGVPLADYDANGDGWLDQLIVVVRSFHPARGLARCTLVGGTAGCASGEASLFYGPPLLASEFGISVDPAGSGQYTVYQFVRPYADLVGLIAHELGHHIWSYHGFIEAHLAPVVGNGVPSNNDSAGALALMLGPGPMYAETSFPTAAERHIVSRSLPSSERWLTCAAPTPGRAYELGDTFSTGDCLRLAFGPTCAGCAGSDVLVSGVYRETPFAQAATPRTTVSADCPGCVRVEAGLPATGVMLELVRFTSSGKAERDLIPPDGSLDTFRGCGSLAGTDPTAIDIFGGDFWTAGATAIHPFSSPNIYGYASLSVTPRSVYDVGGPPHELSGFRSAASGRVAFDYRTDLLDRDSLVAETDWSFGPQFGPLAFESFRMGVPGDFVVTEGTQLTLRRLDLRLARRIVLGADVSLTASETMQLPSGTPLGVEVGARSRLILHQSVVGDTLPVQIGEDGLLHVQGSLVVRGALVVKPGAQLIVDGDLELQSPLAHLVLQGSVLVLGRLITPAGPAQQVQLDGDLDVGGAWEMGAGSVTLSVGRAGRAAATARFREGISMPDDGRFSLSLAAGAEAEVAGLLPIRAGASLVVDHSTLTSGGGLRVETGGVMTVTGGALRFGPDARLEVHGRFRVDFGADGSPSRMDALDDEAGWGGMSFGRGETSAIPLVRNLEVRGVVGRPALLAEDQEIVLSHVSIQAPRAAGAVVIRGGRAWLTRVEVGPASGVGLDVSRGADVFLTPPVQLLGHRVALRVDSSVVRGPCGTAATCPDEPTRILPDRSLPNAAEVELWNGATVRLLHAEWWVESPDRLFVGGDGTGTLEVTPMGAPTPPAPLPPVTQQIGPVTPNPARSAMSVPVSLSGDATVRVSVHDVLGRHVATGMHQIEQGHHRIPLPLGAVPAGTYLLTVSIERTGRDPTRHVQPFTVVR